MRQFFGYKCKLCPNGLSTFQPIQARTTIEHLYRSQKNSRPVDLQRPSQSHLCALVIMQLTFILPIALLAASRVIASPHIWPRFVNSSLPASTVEPETTTPILQISTVDSETSVPIPQASTTQPEPISTDPVSSDDPDTSTSTLHATAVGSETPSPTLQATAVNSETPSPTPQPSASPNGTALVS